MPRIPRLDLPGVPRHVVQRGHDRRRCFFDEWDFRRYLADLGETSRRYAVSVHAYVLMTNHVHLLVTPEAPCAMSRMMQAIGRRYVRYVNTRRRRSGTLWEGRFRASLVDSETYLLCCYRYIELNPVRAGIAGLPDEWPWSSHARNARGTTDPLVTEHPVYTALGADGPSRRRAYRDLCLHALDERTVNELRRCTSAGLAAGSDRFRADIERRLGQRARPGQPGRPRRETLL